MEWVEITVSTTSEASELVANCFFEQLCEGVCIMDKKDVIALLNSYKHWDYVDDDVVDFTDETVYVKGFLPSSDYNRRYSGLVDSLNELKQNSAGYFELGSMELTKRSVDDEDWYEVWKKHYKPIKIKNLIVCPKWIDYTVESNEVVLLMDPGQAFGTGEHETTNICIDLMQEYPLKDRVVLDVGCGSGILGISAIKLGAKMAYMSDIDSVAVDAAIKNSELNGVLDKTKISEANLLDDVSFECDILISNITANILVLMKDDIGKTLKTGKIMILSGIINSKMDEIITEFTSVGLIVDKVINKGEWNGVSFIKQ